MKAAAAAGRAAFAAALGVGAWMLARMLMLAWDPSVLPESDYVSVFTRYIEFDGGRASLAAYVLGKHADHNHSLVYLLALIDIATGDGTLRLLHVVLLASHLAVAASYIALVARLDLDRVTACALGAFAWAGIFAIYGAETWVYPFQVVLASFRALLVAGLLLYCIAAADNRWRPGIAFAALALLLAASLAHGSGVIVFALLLGICVCCRQRRLLLVTLGFAVLFLWHALAFPAAQSPWALLARIPAREWLEVPYYTAFVLGDSLAWGGPVGVRVVAGVLGAAAGIGVTLATLAGWRRDAVPRDPQLLFLCALAAFSLAATITGVLLNLSYAGFRGVPLPPPLEYFSASRYLVTSGGFWFAIAALFARRLERPGRWMLCVIMAASVVACVFQGRSLEPAWRAALLTQKSAAAAVQDDGFAALATDAEMRKLLALPTEFPADQMRAVLETQRRRGLGPFSPRVRADEARLAAQSPAAISDSNWDRGIARHWAGLVLWNTPANRARFEAPGKRLRFADGATCVVTGAKAAGIYLNLQCEGKALDAAAKGFPNRFEVQD